MKRNDYPPPLPSIDNPPFLQENLDPPFYDLSKIPTPDALVLHVFQRPCQLGISLLEKVI